MVQALSVSAGVPNPLGETFAADQFLISEQNTAIFDIALLAPTLISEGSAEDVETVTVNAAGSTSSAEGLTGEASVEMPTGIDAAPAASTFPTSPVSAQAVADHDVALALSALAALEQTSRSPLIAQKARADLLPPSLKTRIGNELAAPNSVKSVEMLSDSGLQAPVINLAFFASIKRDEAHIDNALLENDTRSEGSSQDVTTFPETGEKQPPIAALTNISTASISGISDQDIIILEVTEPKSEMVHDVASSISVEQRTQWPEAIKASISREMNSQPVVSNVSMSSALITHSDFAMQDYVTVSHNDIVVPAIVDAPREERPSFIGELIETPKPIILPNQPVPNAPRLPLADPSSHLDTPAFVFANEPVPPVQARNEMLPDERGQVLSKQIVNEGAAPVIEPSLHNAIDLQKNSDEVSKEDGQNLIPNPALLTSPVLEIVSLEKSEKIEKTSKNKDFFASLSSNSADSFYQKDNENLSLDRNVNVALFSDQDRTDVPDVFLHEISSNEQIHTRDTSKDASESVNSTDPSFIMMSGVISSQMIAPESNAPRDITTDVSTSRNTTNYETFQKLRDVAVARDQNNTPSVPIVNTAPIMNADPIDDPAHPAFIDNTVIRPDLLVQKIEIAARNQTEPSMQNGDTDFDPAEQIFKPVVLSRDNESMRDLTDSQSDSHEPLQQHAALAMPRSNLNINQSDDQKNVPFDRFVDTKTTLEHLNREPITRLVEDEQNAPTMIENKMVAVELHTNRKPDGADIRDVTLVIRSVDQSEPGLAHRTGFSAATSTSESVTASAAAPFTATREASAAPVYASSDNPLFQIQRDRALQAQIIAALKSGQDEVRLSLYPPQLGQVTINLALDGQKVKVGLKTASREATDLLTTEQPSLSHALRQEGFTLEGFDVTEDDTHKHRANGDDQTKTPPIPALSGSSEFSIDITI
ncbi:MAG: flagellar hook-length control protein FliK [Hyphomicrobiales bacterium]|nr:flagellar hook-length control protein FliK [Hyphomicrobiales bacterium]